MENYSTASSTYTSSNTTPCQVYSPLPIRSPLALDICINLSEDVFSTLELDFQAKPSTTQRPNKLLMKKLQRLDKDDESSSDTTNDFELEDPDTACIKKISEIFKQSNFIRPPSRASNPQIHDEVFCNPTILSFCFEKKPFEERI